MAKQQSPDQVFVQDMDALSVKHDRSACIGVKLTTPAGFHPAVQQAMSPNFGTLSDVDGAALIYALRHGCEIMAQEMADLFQWSPEELNRRVEEYGRKVKSMHQRQEERD